MPRNLNEIVRSWIRLQYRPISSKPTNSLGRITKVTADQSFIRLRFPSAIIQKCSCTLCFRIFNKRFPMGGYAKTMLKKIIQISNKLMKGGCGLESIPSTTKYIGLLYCRVPCRSTYHLIDWYGFMSAFPSKSTLENLYYCYCIRS
jgi:hypothetical protein